MKKWYQSKTIWTALLQLIVAIGVVIQTQQPELDGGGYALIVKSLWDLWLRLNTGTRLSPPSM